VWLSGLLHPFFGSSLLRPSMAPFCQLDAMIVERDAAR